MTERPGAVRFNGDPMTLVGDEVKAGDKAPSFTVTGTDLSDFGLDEFEGKVVILSVVPSIDTSTCATQTRRFNKAATGLSDDVVVLTVSMDLPFAQDRFCGAEGLDRIVMASDYKRRVFGEAWGVLLKDIGLLTRAVFVVDREGVVRHAEYVQEATEEPAYDVALEAARQAV